MVQPKPDQPDWLLRPCRVHKTWQLWLLFPLNDHAIPCISRKFIKILKCVYLHADVSAKCTAVFMQLLIYWMTIHTMCIVLFMYCVVHYSLAVQDFGGFGSSQLIRLRFISQQFYPS